MKIRLSAPTLRETLLSILKGENNELEAHKGMIHEFSTFDRFSSGAELPTDFVDSVPVSDVEGRNQKIILFFLVQMKTRKFASEIY